MVTHFAWLICQEALFNIVDEFSKLLKLLALLLSETINVSSVQLLTKVNVKVLFAN